VLIDCHSYMLSVQLVPYKVDGHAAVIGLSISYHIAVSFPTDVTNLALAKENRFSARVR